MADPQRAELKTKNYRREYHKNLVHIHISGTALDTLLTHLQQDAGRVCIFVCTTQPYKLTVKYQYMLAL